MVAKKRKTIWRMTVGEWDRLSARTKMAYADKYPPYPYHSNFHLVKVIDAIKKDYLVPERIIKSFGNNTGIKMALLKTSK